MRLLRDVVLPAFMLVMLVVMPLAGSVTADEPPPQATPVSDTLVEGALVPPTINEICGPDNDEIIPAASQPDGVNPQPEISAWQNSQATLTYTALDGYVFPEGMSNVIVVDELDITDPCEEAMSSTSGGGFNTTQSVEPTVTFDHPKTFDGLPDAGYWFKVTFDFNDFDFQGVPDEEVRLRFELSHKGEFYIRYGFDFLADTGRAGTLTYGQEFSSSIANTCLLDEGNLTFGMQFSAYELATGFYRIFHRFPTQFVEIPCSAETTPEPPTIQSEMCGPNNDEIMIPDMLGVDVADTGWIDGERTIKYSPASYAFFPEGTKTSYTFEDNASESSPCIIDGELNPPTVAEVCGWNNDVITPAASQPYGINPEPMMSNWVYNKATLTYSRTDGSEFAEGFDPVITIEDTNSPCIESVTIHVEEGAFLNRQMGVPVETEVTFTIADGHPYDSIIVQPHQDSIVFPNSRLSTPVELGKGESITLTILLASPNWSSTGYPDFCRPESESINIQVFVVGLTDGVYNEGNRVILELASLPCSWATAVSPLADISQVEVCGSNNDELVVTEQPEGVSYTVHEWSNGSTTVEFYPTDESYYFHPKPEQTVFSFEDKGDCITDAPIIPELLNAVCGDDNDLYSEPDQPENVAMTDSGWSNNERSFTFAVAEGYVLPDGSEIVHTVRDAGDCLTESPILPLLLNAICGDNNDVYASTARQPENVLMMDSGWSNNERSFTFTPGDGYVLPGGSEIVHTVRDAGDCVTGTPIVPELLNAVCGDDNDVYPELEQPEGVVLTDSGWSNNERTFTFAVAEGYVLPGGSEIAHTVRDAGDCVTGTPIVPELLNSVCGADNDVYSEPEQPEGVVLTNSGWSNNERTFSFTADEGYVLPEGSEIVHTVRDAGDCVTGTPIVPELLNAVCGDDNDLYSEPEQPEDVVLADSGWSNNERSFTFTPEDGYVLPEGFHSVHVVSDASTPCPTDAPVPPVQTEVCGPNNDTITIPPQPDGVTLEHDSDWENGARIITFAIDPAFTTDGETGFTFTDENIACPISTTTLSVQLLPSDKGSIDGAQWQLFAPVAAQNVGTIPYATGSVGSDNQIVVDDLIAGDYRLVVNAEGYEPIDTVLSVVDGEQTQVISLDVIALQPVETPTPEPTIEPTTEPTVEPTSEPTAVPTIQATPTQEPTDPSPTPTDEPAAVSGLPSTGSGSGTGLGVLALAGLLAATALAVIGNRRSKVQA